MTKTQTRIEFINQQTGKSKSFYVKELTIKQVIELLDRTILPKIDGEKCRIQLREFEGNKQTSSKHFTFYFDSIDKTIENIQNSLVDSNE